MEGQKVTSRAETVNAPRLPPVSLTCELSPLAEPWQPECAARKVKSCTLVPVYFPHFLLDGRLVFIITWACAPRYSMQDGVLLVHEAVEVLCILFISCQ